MTKFLLFGGLGDVDSVATIHSIISKREHTPLVDAFLSQASSFLRTSFARLPPPRQDIPPFVNLREFLAAYGQQSRRDGLVDSVLLCIAQLVSFLR